LWTNCGDWKACWRRDQQRKTNWLRQWAAAQRQSSEPCERFNAAGLCWSRLWMPATSRTGGN
jgi:hypothetical protein